MAHHSDAVYFIYEITFGIPDQFEDSWRSLL